MMANKDDQSPIIHVVWEEKGERNAQYGRTIFEDDHTLMFYSEDQKTVIPIRRSAILQRSDKPMSDLDKGLVPSCPDISEKELLALIQSLDQKESPLSCSILDSPAFLAEDPNNNPSPNDGYLVIKEGVLQVVDAHHGGGLQPILYPHPDLEIKVNGQMILTPTEVSSKDHIEWSPAAWEEPFEIQVREDKLELFIKLHHTAMHRPYILDQPPKIKLFVEYGWLPYKDPLLKDHIVDQLNKMGVQVPIHLSILEEELETPTYETLLIANGTPVKPAEDGFLECLVIDQVQEIFEEVNGRVDYKDRVRIPAVNKGETIAVIHPPVKGEPGCTVFGEVIQPNEPRKVEYRLGKNVELLSDGKVVALKSGRPSITGQVIKTIEVCRTYTLTENVDMRTGNIYFAGDLVIHGDVCEGMRVEASGNIMIHGNVYSSYVVSTQQVTISGNIFNSHIAGGQHGLFLSRVYRIFRMLHEEMEKLQKSVVQTQQILSGKGMKTPVGRVITLLIESKFPIIPQEINHFSKVMAEVGRKFPVPIEFTILQRMLHHFSHPHLMVTQSIESITSILFTLKTEIERLENSIHEESNVLVGFASQSTIQTNGSVVITGKGMMTSKVFAGKDCIFRDPQAVLKSGQIEANERIIAQEVGSDFGSIPYLNAGKTIQISKVHQVKIRIKHAILEMDSPIERVRFYFSDGMNSIVTAAY